MFLLNLPFSSLFSKEHLLYLTALDSNKIVVPLKLLLLTISFNIKPNLDNYLLSSQFLCHDLSVMLIWGHTSGFLCFSFVKSLIFLWHHLHGHLVSLSPLGPPWAPLSGPPPLFPTHLVPIRSFSTYIVQDHYWAVGEANLYSIPLPNTPETSPASSLGRLRVLAPSGSFFIHTENNLKSAFHLWISLVSLSFRPKSFICPLPQNSAAN